jgi:hypothetical protein
MKEYLVTAQGYMKTDPYKQTIILYDTFIATNEQEAKNQFHTKFSCSHNVIKIYSAEDIS